ncbi:UvrB/UvrC motif-containing protein [Lentisphaerota bacterium ZTH]|nr:UvrB/UvrC motif-containing protein [Lentisphaerota bacterium]WET07605.1 UvrB/UvrC motif-containing protein [Lentisphaerota bacterium ZTH]
MLCDICKQNEATIHIQEIINGEKKTLNLCGDCAAKKSKNDPAFDIGGFNLAEMLYNLSENMEIPGLKLPEEQQEKAGADDTAAKLSCPGCGWSLQGLRKTGRVGCPQCYKTFRSVIMEALENMHRGKLHVGKKPGGSKDDESPRKMLELMNLQKELDELVQREEYEKAAEVRDTIIQLKESLKKQTGGKSK